MISIKLYNPKDYVWIVLLIVLLLIFSINLKAQIAEIGKADTLIERIDLIKRNSNDLIYQPDQKYIIYSKDPYYTDSLIFREFADFYGRLREARKEEIKKASKKSLELMKQYETEDQ